MSEAVPSVLVARPTLASSQSIMRQLVDVKSFIVVGCRGALCGHARPAGRRSRKLCAMLSSAQLNLHFWESYGAEPGESARTQFARQLRGAVEQTLPGRALTSWFEQMDDLVAALLSMFAPGGVIPGSDGHLFYLRLQANVGGACIKYHDDYVGVRAVVALCGDSTVVAPAHCVDWQFWDASGGEIQLSPLASEHARQQAIMAFNERVCAQQAELQPKTGDFLLMRGGALAERPCIPATERPTRPTVPAAALTTSCAFWSPSTCCRQKRETTLLRCILATVRSQAAATATTSVRTCLWRTGTQSETASPPCVAARQAIKSSLIQPARVSYLAYAHTGKFRVGFGPKKGGQ